MRPQDITFPYRRHGDQDARVLARHPVVIAGAGPVGLVLALDLARRGIRPILLDRKRALSDGSRAICWAKRTLEIMDRLELADRLVAKGVTWQRGKVFRGERLLYDFDLLPETGHAMPAFINLQQYFFEHVCVEAAAALGIDVRWGHEVTGVTPGAAGVRVEIATPDGPYALDADWLVAADGVRSQVRRGLGLGFEGQVFDDQFLICDIRMQVQRPTERWFWFDPPFNRGQSALLHRQADDVWRLDFQIGNDADRDEEARPDNVAKRVRAMLGADLEFSFEWISVYRFQCRRLGRFRHGRVLFAGDAAHQVSPFGARGGNSGVQDADNLGWKLAAVLGGQAGDRLLDSYDHERRQAADENIQASSRSTDFITPKGPGAIALRDAVLALAEHEPFARRLINSGRLSLPTTYDGSPLNGDDGFAAGDTPALRPGAPAIDAPLAGDPPWLLPRLAGGFACVCFAPAGEVPDDLRKGLAMLEELDVPVRPMIVGDAIACARYGAATRPALYLFRPDQHIAARWRELPPARLPAAIDRVRGRA